MSFWFGDFELDQERRQLLRGGQPVPLEPKAYELLSLLVERRPKALSRAQIRDAVWPQTFVSESTLGVLVNGIRQALGDDARHPRFVRTVHSFGYAFCGDARQAQEGLAGAAEPAERPYPGLSAFTEADAPFFFGREADVEALWQKIPSRRLLAVIGPSGVGKTSFLRAGVMPNRPPGWGMAYATPGASPAVAVARALIADLTGDAEAIDDLLAGVQALSLTGEPDRAVSAIRAWRERGDQALVVLDQFEELFALNAPEVQARFASLLGRLAEEADVHVLLSLRDDFLFRCSEQESLRPVFQDVMPLTPPSADALRRALVEPAQREGYRFEDDGLVEEMVAAVEGVKGALPLLAFAVARLWEKRDDERKLLTRRAHEEIGGVAGALAQHAEATMGRIGAERHGIVREIFRNLVTAQGTRAVAEPEELLSAFSERREAEEVLLQLIEARLVTSYEEEGEERAAGHGRVEVVHESLLTAWPRLVRWRAQDEDGAQLRDQLKQAAHLWEEKRRPADLLWSGTSFQEYELWRKRYPGALTAVEEAFARAMRERTRRRKRLLGGGVAAAFLALLCVAAAIAASRQQALVARSRAEASKLLALGQAEIARYPTAALAYTTKSLEIEDTPEGRVQALRILWQAPPARVLAMPEGTAALNLAFGRDGRHLAASSFQPPWVTLFSADGRLAQRLTHPQAMEGAGIPFVDFGGDAVFWWDLIDPVLAWTLDGRAFPAFEGPQRWVIGTDDGAFTFPPPRAGASSQLMQQWSVSSGTTRLLRTLRLGAKEGPDRAFGRVSPDPGPSLLVRTLLGRGTAAPVTVAGRHDSDGSSWQPTTATERTLTIDTSGEWRVWSTVDRRLLARRKPPPPSYYSDAVFDPTGSRIGWSSGEGSATYVWDLGDPPDAELLRLAPDNAGAEMGRPAFHPDGRWMAASYGYSTVALWPIGLPRARVLPGHTQGPIQSLRFSPDSRSLVSCARDGMRIWPLGLGDGTQQRVEIPAGPYLCYGADVDSRGETAALAAVTQGLFVVTLTTRVPRRVLPEDPGTFYERCAFDPAGRRLATVRVNMADLSAHLIRDVDLESGAVRTWRRRDRTGGPPVEAPPIGFSWDGRLVVGGNGGIFVWTPGAEEPVALVDAPGRLAWTQGATPDGRWLAALVGRAVSSEDTPRDAELWVLDLTKGTRWPVTSHGPDVQNAALDATGSILVTIDHAGTVRVGSAAGGTPHLLAGHAPGVSALAVSPDRRWIASSTGTEIRLWPMPDLAMPPLHALPHDELMAKLRALTNLRVVEDPAAATGYGVQVGPFPGWEDVPTW